MRQTVFEQLELICPVCRQSGHQSRIKIEHIAEQIDGYLLEGLLECSNEPCRARFPIVQGVPIVLRDVLSWWRNSRQHLTSVRTQSESVGVFFQELEHRSATVEQGWSMLSTYLQAHYSATAGNDFFWQFACSVPAAQADLPSLDLGCSVGRMTFELGRISSVAVGLDYDFRAVSAAAEMQRSGKVSYNRVQSPKRNAPATMEFDAASNSLFLVADALDPPFPARTFGCVAALNLLDNVNAPLTLLGQMDALMSPGGHLLLSCPYQWRGDITEPSQWLEYDSNPAEGFVRAILCEGAVPALDLNYTITSESSRVDWRLSQNERQARHFKVDMLVARKE